MDTEARHRGGKEGLALEEKGFSKAYNCFGQTAGPRPGGQGVGRGTKDRGCTLNRRRKCVCCYQRLFQWRPSPRVRPPTIPRRVCRCHGLRLIKFHSISPASDGLRWALWGRLCGMTAGKGVARSRKIKRPLAGSREAFNCLERTERRAKRQKKDRW